MSAVLLAGVSIAAALIALGLVGSLFVGWGGSLNGALPAGQSTADFGGLAVGLRALRPEAIAQLGLVVLVLTPVSRVGVSLVGFVLERDRLYVAITATVLAILLGSLFLFR